MRTPTGALRTLPWVLGALAVLLQIAWVLLPEASRDPATILTVLLMVAAGVTHAAAHRGPAWTARLYLTTASLGFAVEALGLATGYPFGSYDYGSRLGPALLGVPALVPLAWCMVVYPILLMAQQLAATRAGVALAGGWTLMAWDLFLDPQMVAEGHWTFADPIPGLPGVAGVPFTNHLGWLITGLVLFWLLATLPRVTADDRLPTVLLLWTYAANILAALLMGRPWVAVWGAVAMGVTVLPWARTAIPAALAPPRRHDGPVVVDMAH